MIIFDFFASAFLSVFFSVAPKYWKNCTDEKMKSFVNKLFLILTISQVLKLLFCAGVLVARFLKQHQIKARTAGRAEGGLPFPSVGFFTIGRHSEECTLRNTQQEKTQF